MTRWSLALGLVLACRPSTAPGEATPPSHAGSAAPVATAPAPTIAETPQPVAVRINAEYRDRSAERWAASFEHDGREVFDHRAEIVAALGLRPGMRVADVGAGTGLFTLSFAAAVGSTGRVVAVDVQQYFLDHIAARAAEAKLDNVELRLADQHRTGLEAGSVDVAFLCDAYHHLELPHGYLTDLRRALAPGGRLVIIDYDRTRPGTKAWMKDHIRADPAEFRREIEAAGFVLSESPAVLDENFFWVFEVSRPAR